MLALGCTVRKLNTYNRDPISPLECGFNAGLDFRQPVSLRFFVFAVIFVIFDIELIIVVPLVSSSLDIIQVSWYFVILVNLLSVGLMVEWANTAFEWLKFVGDR